MNIGLEAIRIFLRRKDVKIFIFSVTIGALLQVMAKELIKKYPQLANEEPALEPEIEIKDKENDRRPIILAPRGGVLLEVPDTISTIIKFLSDNGMLAGLITGTTGLVASQIPIDSLSTVVRSSLPNLFYKAKHFIVVKGEKIFLDQCDKSLEYLLKALLDPDLPFEAKQELVNKILGKYVDLSTVRGRITLLLCLISILYALAIQNPTGYYLMMQNLIEAIKSGRISKRIARLIIRKLQRKGVLVDPELIEVAS